jgi:AcrR family transcriptional regulator
MIKKAPRRTAERILEVSLNLFNRFGEPNVSTTLISSELNISPGNLYYHFPAKEELINALFDQFEAKLDALLPASSHAQNVEDAWLFFHMLFERIWEYRFLFRDQNLLLSNSRHLEQHFKDAILKQNAAIQQLLMQLASHSALRIEPDQLQPVATAMGVVMTYWLSFEYVCNPRQALEPESADAAMLRGAQHVLHLLMPYLVIEQSQHLVMLINQYQQRYAQSQPQLQPQSQHLSQAQFQSLSR